VVVTFDQVRDMALAMPGAEEVLTWGTDTTFRVRGRMFAVTAPESSYATVKASPEDQAELLAGDPETFAVAPYTGRFGWVRVELARIEPDHMRELVVEAWRRTASTRQVATYEKD
jgi:hypothetical protein